MSPANLIADFVAIMEASGPLPDIHDRAAIKAAVIKEAPAVIDLIFDAGGFDAVKTSLAGVSPGELELVFDGHRLKWITDHLPAIISEGEAIINDIKAIIAIIPK